MYDKLVAKVSNIDTSEFILKTKYDTDKWDLERKSEIQTKKSYYCCIKYSWK